MKVQYILAALLSWMGTLSTRAQVHETFADGTLTQNPEWLGEVSSWMVVPSGNDFALRSSGAAASDTIFIATPSHVAYGAWSFTFSYYDVNLSNFNGTRVYLTSDQADLQGDLRGYFIQFGTNNSDEIRLYRQDGPASTARIELARSEQKVLESLTQSLHVLVTRTAEGVWSVHANESLLFTAHDNTYTSSFSFGFWVKHTAAAASAYSFDDIAVTFDDSQAPRVLFAEQISENQIDVYFDERIDASSVAPASFDIEGSQPESVSPFGDFQWRLSYRDRALPRGREWKLGIRSVRDLAGNELVPDEHIVAQQPTPGDVVVNEIMYEPRPMAENGQLEPPEYIELYNRTNTTLTLNGTYRTRTPDESGNADTLLLGTWMSTIPPGDFAVIFADTSSESNTASSRLAQAFPNIDFEHEGVTLLPVHHSSLSLRNSGDLIRLHRLDGMVLDEVTYNPDWHNPALVDAAGVSLERIAADRPADETSNWSSCPEPSGGTPGLPNAASREPSPNSDGSTLSVEPSPFSPDGDGFEDVTTIHYSTSLGGGSTRIRIYDSHGRLVRTIVPAALTSPVAEYTWDGLDDNGQSLRMGIYIVVLDAVFPNAGVTELHKQAVVLARPLN